jgi:Gram-negative porin
MNAPVHATLVVLLSAGPARALEPSTFGNFEATFEGGMNATVVRNDGHTLTSGYLDFYLIYRQQVGDLTFGTELFSEITYDSEVEPELSLADDPYIDAGLWLESEGFGYLAYSHTSSAIGEHCVEAPSTGDNFGHGDYVTVGTCPAFDARSVLFYRTPDLGGGLQVAASYMPQTGFESVEAGDAAESISLALILDRKDDGGAQWTGSVGFEKVLKAEGDGAEATAYQVGLNWARDGWTLGGSVAVTENGDRTRDRGLALGASCDVSDKFTASLGVNHSQSRADRASPDETSVAVIGMYSFVPDKVILDGGVWHIRSDDAGVVDNWTVIGIGFSLYF